MDYKKFYISTGKLIFAIAKADGKIQSKETRKLNDIIGEEVELLSKAIGFNEKDTDSDAALEFELLHNKNANSTEAYDAFISFYKENEFHINHQMKEEIVSFAKRIAKSFEGVSPVEAKIIEKLKTEFFAN